MYVAKKHSENDARIFNRKNKQIKFMSFSDDLG